MEGREGVRVEGWGGGDISESFKMRGTRSHRRFFDETKKDLDHKRRFKVKTNVINIHGNVAITLITLRQSCHIAIKKPFSVLFSVNLCVCARVCVGRPIMRVSSSLQTGSAGVYVFFPFSRE